MAERTDVNIEPRNSRVRWTQAQATAANRQSGRSGLCRFSRRIRALLSIGSWPCCPVRFTVRRWLSVRSPIILPACSAYRRPLPAALRTGAGLTSSPAARSRPHLTNLRVMPTTEAMAMSASPKHSTRLAVDSSACIRSSRWRPPAAIRQLRSADAVGVAGSGYLDVQPRLCRRTRRAHESENAVADSADRGDRHLPDATDRRLFVIAVTEPFSCDVISTDCLSYDFCTRATRGRSTSSLCWLVIVVLWRPGLARPPPRPRVASRRNPRAHTFRHGRACRCPRLASLVSIRVAGVDARHKAGA